MSPMSAQYQIEVPSSFIALFVPPGRIKPTASREHIFQRYELCEDLASLCVDTAQTNLWALGITEADVLSRIHAGLLGGAGGVDAREAQWVICRLAELLGWDSAALPAFHVEPQAE